MLAFAQNLAGTGSFTLGASGVGAVPPTVKGKPAHAGVNPDTGISMPGRADKYVELDAIPRRL